MIKVAVRMIFLEKSRVQTLAIKYCIADGTCK
jgi:hypothetical protein